MLQTLARLSKTSSFCSYHFDTKVQPISNCCYRNKTKLTERQVALYIKKAWVRQCRFVPTLPTLRSVGTGSPSYRFVNSLGYL